MYKRRTSEVTMTSFTSKECLESPECVEINIDDDVNHGNEKQKSALSNDTESQKEQGKVNIAVSLDDEIDKENVMVSQIILPEKTSVVTNDHTDVAYSKNVNNGFVNRIDDTNENILSPFSKCFEYILTEIKSKFVKYKSKIKSGTLLLLFLAYLSYVGYSFYVEFGDEGSWRLLICTVIGISLVSWRKLKSSKIGRKCLHFIKSDTFRISNRARKIVRWILYLAVSAVMIGFLVMTVMKGNPENLISLSGIVVFIVLLIITRENNKKINWHSVFWGFSLQFIFAVLIMRTTFGAATVQWASDRLTEFMNYANVGSAFVFGDSYKNILAFSVLPQVIFFCAGINVLFHFGVLHFINRNIGSFLGFCTNTSPAESISAAANMFLGGFEVAIIVKEYLSDMSESELFTLYVNGLASMGGAAMVTFIGFGVPANHLISASVMSAPAALAASKLNWPGEPESTRKRERDKKKTTNALQALFQGAKLGLSLASNVAISMIVFLAGLEFFDQTVIWFGNRAGLNDFSLKLILSYLLWPFAFLMGVESDDCLEVSRLLGIRSLANVGPSYIELGQLFDNKGVYRDYTSRYNDSVIYPNRDIFLPQYNQTLVGGILSDRSEIITTYALCGFASVVSIGTSLGGYAVVEPKLLGRITKMSFRAIFVGTLASYFTACIAGLLFEESTSF